MRYPYDLCEKDFIDQFRQSYGIKPANQIKIFRYAEIDNHHFTGGGQTFYWTPDLYTYKSGSLPYDITTPMFIGAMRIKLTVPISIASPSYKISIATYNYLSINIGAGTVNEGYFEYWWDTTANTGNDAPFKFQTFSLTPEKDLMDIYGPGYEFYFNGTASDQISIMMIFQGWRVQLG